MCAAEPDRPDRAPAKHATYAMRAHNSFMGKMGVKNCVELSWWEEVELEGGSAGAPAVRLASTPAQHWSTRMVWDRNTR